MGETRIGGGRALKDFVQRSKGGAQHYLTVKVKHRQAHVLAECRGHGNKLDVEQLMRKGSKKSGQGMDARAGWLGSFQGRDSWECAHVGTLLTFACSLSTHPVHDEKQRARIVGVRNGLSVLGAVICVRRQRGKNDTSN